jgi:cytosine/adenosine deaminase-related metal-dependent hydrolase
MRAVIAEQLEHGTGTILGARTLHALSAQCRLIGNGMIIGVVTMKTGDGRVSIRVSADPKHYQRARVYEDDKLVESFLVREGNVVYVDEAAVTVAPDAVSP